LLLLQGQEAEASLRVSDAPLHELQVGEVLLCVGVEEALGVITGVQQDLIHLLIEEAPLVGDLHRQAVALLGVDDAAGGNLSLQQADPMVLQDQPLLHGLEEGDELPGVGVPVASDGPLSRKQLVLELRAHDAHANGLLHCQLQALDGVDDIACGCLCLQELKGGARPDDAFLHGLVDREPLLDAHLLVGGFDQQPSNAAPALQVPPDLIPLCELTNAHSALHQLLQALLAQDTSVHQLPCRHLLTDAAE
ncbi:hypothetical protein N333_03528, partial [Nestor notabilis]